MAAWARFRAVAWDRFRAVAWDRLPSLFSSDAECLRRWGRIFFPLSNLSHSFGFWISFLTWNGWRRIGLKEGQSCWNVFHRLVDWIMFFSVVGHTDEEKVLSDWPDICIQLLEIALGESGSRFPKWICFYVWASSLCFRLWNLHLHLPVPNDHVRVTNMECTQARKASSSDVFLSCHIQFEGLVLHRRRCQK